MIRVILVRTVVRYKKDIVVCESGDTKKGLTTSMNLRNEKKASCSVVSVNSRPSSSKKRVGQDHRFLVVDDTKISSDVTRKWNLELRTFWNSTLPRRFIGFHGSVESGHQHHPSPLEEHSHLDRQNTWETKLFHLSVLV